MNRRGVGVGWRLGLLLIATDGATAEGPSALYQAVDAQVVCLRTLRKDRSELVGAGFFVRPDVVATVAHQLADAEKVTAHLPDGRQSDVQILVANRDQDVALVRVPATGNAGLTLAGETLPLLGAEVFTIGCPMELDHSLSRGVVSNPRRKLEGKELIQTDLVVNNGNSGGPLLDQRGQVIGLIMGSFKGASGLNLAVPVRYLNLAFKEIPGSLPPANPPSTTVDPAKGESDPVKRLAIYQQLLTRQVDSPQLHFWLGSEYYRSNQLDLARRHFETAVKLDAGQIESMSNLGLVLHKIGEHRPAVEMLVKAITKDPTFAVAYLNLGMVYANGLGDLPAARLAFGKYIELAPSEPKAAEIRAWLDRNP